MNVQQEARAIAQAIRENEYKDAQAMKGDIKLAAKSLGVGYGFMCREVLQLVEGHAHDAR